VAKHTPCVDVGFKHFVICPECHASYLVRNGFLGALAFAFVVISPLLIAVAVLSEPVRRGEITPLTVIVIAAAVTLPLAVVATYVARRFWRYEYVGRSAT
jgi:hypothetical protein